MSRAPGIGRNIVPSIQLNTVLFAQIATASIAVAVIVKPGLLRILHQKNVSKLPGCRLSRRLFRLASRHSICNRHLQVGIDLFLQFAVSPLKTEVRKPFHDSLSFGLTYITDPIASTIRSHRPRSEANCFFPLAVIR
jgi:hypothetical protein